MTLSISKFMGSMPKAFVPEKAADLNVKVQFDFVGEGGGQYVVSIHDGQCEVAEGTADDAKTKVTVTASDYIDIAEGRLDGMKAFMSGKLKVKGDMMLMMKFQQLFDRTRVAP